MNNKILVTGYENPDLDGVACAIAYAEFLSNKGRDASAVIFGSLQREAEYVLQTNKIKTPVKGELIIEKDTPVILVDASDLIGLSNKIDAKQVIELFDHRSVNDSDKFPNATKHIELVGSCATIIAEKFYHDGVEISASSTIALFSAIVSNTINFLASVTTDRDRKMAEWLKTKCAMSQSYIHDMFAYKSQITKPLKEVFDQTIAHFLFNNKTITIVQIELIDAEKFVRNNIKEISRVLGLYKSEISADYIFLTAIDVEKGGNIFVIIDDDTKWLLEQGLLVNFMGNIAKRPGVMMRKTMTPILKELLEKGI